MSATDSSWEASLSCSEPHLQAENASAQGKEQEPATPRAPAVVRGFPEGTLLCTDWASSEGLSPVFSQSQSQAGSHGEAGNGERGREPCTGGTKIFSSAQISEAATGGDHFPVGTRS